MVGISLIIKRTAFKAGKISDGKNNTAFPLPAYCYGRMLKPHWLSVRALQRQLTRPGMAAIQGFLCENM